MSISSLALSQLLLSGNDKWGRGRGRHSESGWIAKSVKSYEQIEASAFART